jgi:hypothetical protein
MGVAPHAQAQAQAGMSFMSVLCGAIPQIPRWAYARAGDALLRVRRLWLRHAGSQNS